jgi:hypothetical protein
MKKLCICVEIHIPSFPSKHKAFETNENRDDREMHEEKTVKKVASENILPFFQFIQKINSFSDRKITFGISISGIALTLLQEYSPEVITRLSSLNKNNYVELFSETWSHSAVAYFNQNSFRRQIQMHDRLMKSYFGKIPQVLFVHSPQYPVNLLDDVASVGKKAVFMNSNQLDEETFKRYASAASDEKPLVLPVDYVMSQLIQNLDFDLIQKQIPNLTRGIIQKLKNYAFENYPAIVSSNLTRTKCFFHLSRSLTWERLIKRILSDSEIALVSPSEALQKENHSGLNDENIVAILSRSKLRDDWIMNGHQKEAFKKQLDIDTRINAQESEALLKEWDHYQDMDHLYFMGDKFVRKQHSSVHFSPFSNPAAAYSNYMETLNNLTNKMQSGMSLKMRSSKSKMAF